MGSMTVVFDKDYLKDLYLTGKADKKHRFQPDIVRKYKRCIDYLKHSRSVADLFQIASLRYEVLKGEKAGISSIRVNDRYRVEFIVRESGEPVVIVCNILELSNHYR